MPVRRSPVVDDRRPAGGGRGGELRIVAEERVEPRQDVQPGRDGGEDDRPPGSGRRPPVGAIPMSSASGGLGQRSASSSDRDDRDVVPRQVGVDVLAGLRRVDDRDDVIASVADDAVRGLAAVWRELALGEDDEAAMVGWTHRASVRIRPTPRCDDARDGWSPSDRRRRRGVRSLVRAVGSAHPGRRRGRCSRSLDAPWWIVGGWAIDAFTGRPREHHDIDVGFFRADLPRSSSTSPRGLRLVQRERHAPTADACRRPAARLPPAVGPA